MAERLTPETIALAQECVSKIRGISSCRIATDESGEITEVHVTATTSKPAKLIARDVESCLQAEMGLAVDHRKIGVVVLEGGGDERESPPSREHPPRHDYPSDGPLSEFPIEEYPSRFAFRSVNLFLSHDSVRSEVELLRDGVETFGAARSDNLSVSQMRLVAEATLRAVAETLDENIRLWLSDVLKVQLGTETVVVVKVDLQRDRETKGLAGCSLQTGNTNQTVVFATLDAINRVLGAVKTRSSVEYKIR
jgi:hypothetical protein